MGNLTKTRYQAVNEYLHSLEYCSTNILEVGAGDNPISPYIMNTDKAELDIENIRDVIAFEKKYGKFNLIIMNAVIEHLIEPSTALLNLRHLLYPDGRIYINTPNIAHYGNRLKLLRGRFPSTASRNEGLTNYDGSETTEIDQDHLHYFTFRSLRLLAERLGFKTEKHYQNIAAPPVLAELWPEMFSDINLILYKS